MKSIALGILCMIVHCCTLSAVGAYSRVLVNDVNAIQFTMLMSLMGLVFIIPFAIHKKYKLTTKNQKLNFTRALLCTLDQVLLYYVLSQMPFAQVTALTLAYPLIATILAVLILKEKIRVRRITSLIIGLIGSLIIINPTSDNFSLTMSLLVILVITIWGLLDIITKIASAKESITTQLTSLLIFIILCSIIPTIMYWKNFDLLLIYDKLLISGVIWLVSMASMYTAFKNAELCILVPLYFTSLIFSALIAYFVFDEIIQTQTIVGSIIVIFSSSYIAYREYKVAIEQKEQTI